MRIVIAPYAAKLPTDQRNAKNYPFWRELIALLNADGHEVIQLGIPSENRIEGIAQFVQGFPLNKLVDVIRDCDLWISVDSWMPHFCATERLQSGIVIWAQSNPRIWGYPHNTNLLKSPEYLRQFQYAPWYDVSYNEDAFVSPEVVVEAVNERLRVKAA